MLYNILKAYARFFVHLCYHSINVDKPQILHSKEAILIASNHPNSFLDAILFDILFDIPVTSLARGDAFKNPKIYKILRALNMLPVYRSREGAENLNSNYDTFDDCVKIFENKEGVLIFSEGLCVNEWHLRPLLKGTARLAFKSWNANVPVKVLPAGINYSSFSKYGKKINVHFGDFILADEFDKQKSDGQNNVLFNEKLNNQLQQLVYEIAPNDAKQLKEKFSGSSALHKIVLAPFALLGTVLHLPVYGLARWVAKKFFAKTNHFDSVMFGVPMLVYPLYVILISVLTLIFSTPVCALFMFLLLPFTAFCYSKFDVRKG